MSSLKEDLAALHQELAASMPEDAIKILKRSTQRAGASSTTDSNVTVGDQFPHFSLPNVVGNAISSEDLLAQGPLVVSFYRGGWCPYCNLELRAPTSQFSKKFASWELTLSRFRHSCRMNPCPWPPRAI